MILAVPHEDDSDERRVALVPETVSRLAKSGVTVRIQRGAGAQAAFLDDAYEKAGATLVADLAELTRDADAVATVGRPSEALLATLEPGTVVVGFLHPLGDPEYVKRLAAAGVTAMAVELIPRITRAQSMDALSSQSNIAGYKAVLLAAAALPKFFPMLTTAAGTIPPAKALILGAVVSGYDVRAVVKEQVQSLGATFLEFDLGADAEASGGYAKELTPEQQERQRVWMVEQIGANDVVITTALVPGRRAPVLVSEDAVAAMKPGSVIVDLAAEAGGNCALTVPGETIVSPNGVTIIGTTNLAGTLPYHASQLYSRNLFALLSPMVKDGALVLDPDDEIVEGCCIVRDGNVLLGGSPS